MITALHHDNDVILDFLDEPMRASDTPRPTTSQIVTQGLRLADAAKRIAVDIMQEAVNAISNTRVGFLPVTILFGGAALKEDLHGISISTT